MHISSATAHQACTILATVCFQLHVICVCVCVRACMRVCICVCVIILRLSFPFLCPDTIAVVMKGQIVEQGSHNVLIGKKSGVYADLVRRQSSPAGDF